MKQLRREPAREQAMGTEYVAFFPVLRLFIDNGDIDLHTCRWT